MLRGTQGTPHLLRLVQVCAAERLARCRQPHHEQLAHDLDTGETERDRPEVDLGLHPQPVSLGDRHLDHRQPDAGLGLTHVLAHRRLRHHSMALINKALPDPASRLTLLARRRQISRQPAIHDRLPPVHHRRRPLLDLAWRRDRRRQRQMHHPTVRREPARQLTHRHRRIITTRTPDLLEQLHLGPSSHPERSTPPHPATRTPTTNQPRWGQIRASQPAESGATSECQTHPTRRARTHRARTAPR